MNRIQSLLAELGPSWLKNRLARKLPQRAVSDSVAKSSDAKRVPRQRQPRPYVPKRPPTDIASNM
ncbi:MAG: hypothetical protein AB7I79_15170 [Rhizobiaceae bacterium]